MLDAYPGSSYLRTDQTCPSLNQSIDGAPIYVVYFGPFAFASDACAARADGTEGAYARRLSNDVGPNHGVSCPDPSSRSEPRRLLRLTRRHGPPCRRPSGGDRADGRTMFPL